LQPISIYTFGGVVVVVVVVDVVVEVVAEVVDEDVKVCRVDVSALVVSVKPAIVRDSVVSAIKRVAVSAIRVCSLVSLGLEYVVPKME
jgi:hypothetical protein